ncbi:hypothetical protein TNCV_3209311 [Trichonephila clavipes]|nr:hypothetical protein TNCV_3209311 [Trichonephila clavipes]
MSHSPSRKGGDREGRLEDPRPPFLVFFLKIGAEWSQNVLSPAWFSKLRQTTGVKVAPCRDEFRGPRSDTLKRVVSETTKRATTTRKHPIIKRKYIHNRFNVISNDIVKVLVQTTGDDEGLSKCKRQFGA